MRELLFFIGTEAELMKMFIVIKKAQKRGFTCSIVSSGQNDIHSSKFLELSESKIDVDLSLYAPKKKSGKEYLKWIIKTIHYGSRILKKRYRTTPDKPIMVIHGDTLSTLMGAMIARKAGFPFCHVEGGLRSYNWLNPFPEEIDRYFSSKHADIVFVPGKYAVETARKSFKNKKVVDTVVNTNYEVLSYARTVNHNKSTILKMNDKYFVAAIHRQENLLSREFMEKSISAILKLSKRMHCVFIYHVQTKNALEKYGLFEKLKNGAGVTLVERLDYFDFISVVEKSEFLLADGAGNQQEMYYLGKPYLILRGFIEQKSEGLGSNAISYMGDFKFVEDFWKNYADYRKQPLVVKDSPSDIIIDNIVEYYHLNENK